MQTEEKNANKILNGAVWLGISAFILKLIGLIYKIPMSYILGDEGMGYFNCAYTVYTLFYILGSAGIPKAISILCSKSSAEEGKYICLTAFKFLSLLGAILTLGLFMFSNQLSELVANKNASYAMMAIAPSIFFVTGSGVLRGYLTGKMRFMPIAVSELIGGMCKLFLGIILAYFAVFKGYSLPLVCAFSILGITIGTFFGLVFLYLYFKKESKDIKKIYLSKKGILSEIVKIGLPITFASVLTSLVSIIDLSIIMNGLERAGYSDNVCTVIYGNYTTLAVPLLGVVITLINPISLSALPIISKAYSERKYETVKSALDSTVFFSSYISCPAFFLFLFFSYETLSFLFEIGSATLGAVFLCALAPAVIFYSFLMPVNTLLESTGRVKIATFSLICGAVIKSIVSFLLIGTELFGAIAAPLGTTVSYFVSMLISLSVAKKDKKIKLNLFKHYFLPVCFSSIAATVAIFFKFSLTSFDNIRLKSFMIILIYGLIYMSFAAVLMKKQLSKKKKLSNSTKNTVLDY